MHNGFINSIQSHLAAFFVRSTIPSLFVSVLVTACPNNAYANDLALGSKSKINGPIDIPIVAPADFNFKPKAEIFQMRAAEVLKHKELLQDNYAPSQEVFGQIVDKRPWWGLLGEAYYGPGENSIKGLSEESRFILNPFLLAGEASVCSLPKRRISQQDVVSHYYPTYLRPSGLRWWPKDGKAEVTYGVTAYTNEMSRILGLSHLKYNGKVGLEVINARDLGLNYFYIPVSWAYHFNITYPMTGPLAVPQLIHCGRSCGYPGGCNNMSPRCNYLADLTITELPARLTIMFWKQAPTSNKEKPDIIYTVNFH